MAKNNLERKQLQRKIKDLIVKNQTDRKFGLNECVNQICELFEQKETIMEQ